MPQDVIRSCREMTQRQAGSWLRDLSKTETGIQRPLQTSQPRFNGFRAPTRKRHSTGERTKTSGACRSYTVFPTSGFSGTFCCELSLVVSLAWRRPLPLPLPPTLPVEAATMAAIIIIIMTIERPRNLASGSSATPPPSRMPFYS